MNAPTTSAARFAGHRVAGVALVAVECFVAVGAVFGGVGRMGHQTNRKLTERVGGPPKK